MRQSLVTWAGGRRGLLKGRFAPRQHLHGIFHRQEHRNQVIDGLRAFGVLIVIAFHVIFGVVKILGPDRLQKFIDDFPAVCNFLWQGDKGVDILFLLSGFMVAGNLLREKARHGAIDVKLFYQRRLLRIMPLFFIALNISLLVNLNYYPRFYLSNLFFVNNLIPGQSPIIPVGWSLNIEMQLYLLLPLLLLVVDRIRWPAVFLLAVYASSSLVTMIVLLAKPGLYQTPLYYMVFGTDGEDFAAALSNNVYETIHTRFGPFILGCCLAYLTTHRGDRLRQLYAKPWVATGSFVLGSLLFLSMSGMPLQDRQSSFYAPFRPEWNLVLLAVNKNLYVLGLALLMLGALYPTGINRVVARLLSARIWYPVSQLIFPMYLFHFPMIILAAATVFMTIDPTTVSEISFLRYTGVVLVAWVYTFAFSVPFHIFVERPFMEVLTGRRPKADPAPAVGRAARYVIGELQESRPGDMISGSAANGGVSRAGAENAVNGH